MDMQSVTETEPKVGPSHGLPAGSSNMKVRWRENLVCKKEREAEGAFSKSPVVTERATSSYDSQGKILKKKSKCSNKKMHGNCLEKTEKSKGLTRDRARKSSKKDEEILLKLMKKISIQDKPKKEKKIKKTKKEKTASNEKDAVLHSSMKNKKTRKSTWKCVSFSSKTVSKHYVRVERSSTSTENSVTEECHVCGISNKEELVEEPVEGNSMSRSSKSRSGETKTFKDMSKRELNTLRKNRENRANSKFINRVDSILSAFYKTENKGEKRKLFEELMNVGTKTNEQENLRKKIKSLTPSMNKYYASKNVDELAIVDKEEEMNVQKQDLDSSKISDDDDDDDIQPKRMGVDSGSHKLFQV